MRTSSKRGLSLSTSLLLALSLLMFAVQTPYRAEALDFGTPINLSDNATDSDAQQVVASGSNVFVMWTDDPPMNCCILLSVSTDSGASFGDPVNIAGRQPQIAVSGSYVFITYVDQSFSGDVFVVVSDDNGATFGTPENISNSAGDSANPQIAVSGSNVFVTYEDDTLGNSEVFVAASTDSGDNFGTPVNVSNNTGYSGVINFGSALTIAASGSNVFVTWEDNSGLGSFEVFFARSTDTGSTFNQINLSDSVASSFDPRMAISGSNVFVVWSELIGGVQFDIMMKKSADGGAIFGSAINISSNAGGSSGSQIAASGSKVYVMWTDSISGNGDILVKASIDSGDNFGATVNVSNNAGTSGGIFSGQKITAIANNVFVTWADSTPGNTDIFIAESTDSGANFGDGINVSNTVLGSADPHVAVSGSNQFVTWTEFTPDIGDSSGPSEIYYVTNLATPITPQPGIIAFYSGSAFSEEIYVMDSNGDNRINVSNDPAYDADPALSPDGTKIAFTSFRDGNYEIYVMDADGDNQMNVSNDPASDYYPNWSPDGTKIGFTRYVDTEPVPNEQVWVMDADGNNQMALTPAALDFDESRPAFSPDGTKIAFSSTLEGSWDVYVMDSSGDRDSLTNLSNDDAFASDAAWSPDGSQIAFTSARDGNFEVYVMDSDDGGGLDNLSENGAWDSLPSWSPDGSQIAFHSTRDGTFQIFLMEADGDLPTNISNNEVDDSDPSWALPASGAQPTSLTLNPLRDVTATTGFTVSGELVNDDTGEGISGQLITFDGDGVTPSLQSVMTEGVTFTGTIDIVACPTPVVPTPTTCTTDNVGDDDTTSENMVLHLGDDGKIGFPAGTVTAKIYLQDMGTSSFKYIVEEGDGALQPEATSAGAESPVVPVLSIVSGYTDGDPNGLKELTITEITGGTSVGIAAVLTGNPDGLPVEQHQINFEEFAAGSKTSPFTVNAGFYFSTGFAQNIDEEGLEITAHFAGTGGLMASDSTTETYNVLANTAGLGGEGSQGLGGAVGTSITTLDCNTDVGSVDSDNDGICDLWETTGVTLGGANYPLTGAEIGQKDIFVEIDCMTGFCPTAADLTAVRNAFSAEGFTLHMAVDENNIAVQDPLHVWSDNTPAVLNDFDSIKKAKFGSSGERSGGTLGQGNEFLRAKAQVYHYGLFVKNINTGTSTACGPSGQAELRGNDFIVSVGCTGTNGFQNSAQERQGTLMHELGHNLGLRHGGGDDDNCKANLISVMSYTRQMPWGSLSATTTGSNPTEWALTYSRQDLADLIETNLQEGAGLTISTGQWGGTLASGSTSFKVIWGIPAVKTGSTGNTVNWNNAAGNTASLNINTLSGMTGCTGTVKSTLKSYNEWAILDLNFRDEGTIDGLVYPDEDTVAELTPPVLAGAEAASVVGPNNVFNNIGLSALPDVATDADDNIYVVWSEKASFSSSFEIYFSKSIDDGATFSPPENISNNAGTSLTPRIEESDGILYVVWSDKTGGTSNNYDIRLSKSSNMGDDWDSSVKLSSNSGDSLTPSIAVSGSDIYVVWSDKTSGTSGKFDIQFKKSVDGGTNFTPNTASGNKVSSNGGNSLTPDVDVSSSGIFVVWSDTSGGTSSKFDILMKKSSDGGTTFLPNTANAKNISTNSGHSLTPSLAVDEDSVYVTWSDTTGGTSGNFDILFKKSTDGGNNFTPNTANAENISTTSSLSATPRIVASSGSIYIAWSDNGVSGRFDIFAKKSGDAGENFEAAQNISGNSGHSLTPAIVLTGPVLNLVWGDLTPGITGDIMYASRIV